MDQAMDKNLSYLWAKTSRSDDGTWHPLLLHLLDVAASAEAILAREPEATRTRMGTILGLDWENARPLLILVIACHDLGKACPGFQSKWTEVLKKTGLRLPKRFNDKVNHGFVGQLALEGLLARKGWPGELADKVADAVGCHHGTRASSGARERAFLEIAVGRGRRLEAVRDDWDHARLGLFNTLADVFSPKSLPTSNHLDGPNFMLLAGLTSFADWIGSNETWFPFGTPGDCECPGKWYQGRKAAASRALDEIGWDSRSPLSEREKAFEQHFGLSPRPLQETVETVLRDLEEPAVLLIEAPMGEGKTEAAFHAHLELQRKCGHRGLYIALPTKATGNAMFSRTMEFLDKQKPGRMLDLQLVHGAKLLSELFQGIRITGIHGDKPDVSVRAGEWFTSKKRALLSEYGVGTVDQALLPILPVRHNFVRLWGLANRVVVFDEIHAYDAYTGTLLVHLLRWLLALGSSVVLLSATLPPHFRRKMAEAVGADPPEREADYPRLTVFHQGTSEQVHFEADPSRRLEVKLGAVSSDPASIQSALHDQLTCGGLALALMNTVQRAQDLFRLFPDGTPITRGGELIGKRLDDGTEMYLFHARYPADQRQAREDNALETFGRDSDRAGRKILIATQVAEQSLDLDFDLILTDLAPIDLLLQRAGRLWRHERKARPLQKPLLLVAGIDTDMPTSFGKPLWWNKVYREDVLLRTFCLLRGRPALKLPGDIDPLVRAVYEEQVEVPDDLRERLERALVDGEGAACAEKIQADHAIIGLPDDSSWDKPDAFVLYDEDEPGVHRTIMAQTRLGDDSVEVVPLKEDEGFDPKCLPDIPQAKAWYLRSLRVSRKSVVLKTTAAGVPQAWKSSPLLRNCYPLILDSQGRWVEDEAVRLDDDLGLIYEEKEVG